MARFSYVPNRVIDTNGISDGASMYFYQTGTTTPISIFSDDTLTTPLPNPYVVVAGAAVPTIYYEGDNNVRVKVVSVGGEVISDDDPVITSLLDQLDAANAAAEAAEVAEAGAVVALGGAEVAQAAAEEAAAGALSGGSFRAQPNAVFNWLPILGRSDAPGRAEISEHVPDYAKRVHSALITPVDVYVDSVSGLDANSGSVGSPVLTLNNALRTKGGSYVYLIGSKDPANPRVFRKSDFRASDTPGNKLKIVTPIGHCIVEEEGSLASALTWTVGPIYEATPTLVGGVPPIVVEYKGWLRPDGQPYRLRKYATSADINTLGLGIGWAWDGTKIYIRVGGLNVEANKADFKITYGNSGSRCLIYGAAHILFNVGSGSSLIFNGVSLAPYQLAGARPTLYARGVEVRNCSGHGIDCAGGQYAVEECVLFANAGDNLHPADDGGLGSRVAEINCISREAGDFDTYGVTAGGTANGSSMHGTGHVMRLGGEYRDNGGPNVVDTGTGKSLNMGIITGSSRATSNGYGFYATASAVEMWLDTCHGDAEPTSEITADNGCTIHRFRTTAARATTVGTGVIDDYTPVPA